MPIIPARIVFLDVPGHALEGRMHKLFDNFNLNEIDLIVWNTIAVAVYLPRGQQGQAIGIEQWRKFKNRYLERVDEIISWLKRVAFL
jgi:hypothetical protein